MALRRKGSRASGGDLFPGFTDIAEIGTGSLATVYRAREIGTNRRVALKLLNVRDASPRALESFQRESIALGELSSHPNIVTLFRNFPSGDGRPVLVLELCVGSVGDRLRGGGSVPVPEAVSIAIKTAGALETAHRAEILHRDVKPQNILITEFGEPALADFGVAMLQSSTQTTAGLFDFTTLHAAPELLEGGATSAATDVYELASTLYQLIAGQSAFRAYDGESPASVILRILRDPVRPVLAEGVPVALSDLLIQAMSKEKDHRPPTAAEFAAELARIEIEQGWPRTQFLIRDPAGTSPYAAAPMITRLPDAVPRPMPLPVAPAMPVPMSPPAAVMPPVPAMPPAAVTPPVPVMPSAAVMPAPVLPAAPVPPAPADPIGPPRPTSPPATDAVTNSLGGHREPLGIDDESLALDPQDLQDLHDALSDLPVDSDPGPEDDEPEPRPEPIVPPEPTPPPNPFSPPVPNPAPEPAPHPTPEPEPEPIVPPEPKPPEALRPAPVAAVRPVAPTPGPVPPIPPPTLPPPQQSAPLPPAALPTPPAALPTPPPTPPPPPPEPVPTMTGSWWAPLPTDPAPSTAEGDRPLDQPGAHAMTAAPAYPGAPATEQYPIPPAAGSGEPTFTDVPTWALRAPAPMPAISPQFVGDLSIDPQSLHRKLTVRAGFSAVTVDERHVTLRSGLRRTRLPWTDVRGFEPRFDEPGAAHAPAAFGALALITVDGPVLMPGTRRPLAELSHVHALLDAYRIRAQQLATR